MAREYGKTEFWSWPGIQIDMIYAGPKPVRAKDFDIGVVAHDTQHVYVFRDEEASPIYVGRTFDPASRFFRHMKKAPWWHDAKLVDLWLLKGPDRATVDAAVCDAEKWFINAINPSRNIVRARGGDPNPLVQS